MPSVYEAPKTTTLSLADVLSDLSHVQSTLHQDAAARGTVDHSRQIESYLSSEAQTPTATQQATMAYSKLVSDLMEASDGKKLGVTGDRIEQLQREIGQFQRTIANSLHRV